MLRKKKYILVCTDFVTKWVEAKSLYQATEKLVVEFIYEDIFTCFGVPREIVTDQGSQFTSKMMKELTNKYGIKHCKSSPYHPQANGQVNNTTVEYARWKLVIIIGSGFVTLILSTKGGLESSNKI
jgi:transposase InsO family protein